MIVFHYNYLTIGMIVFHYKYLVGGWATPLKNDGVRQLGWWQQPNISGKIKNGNQTTNQIHSGHVSSPAYPWPLLFWRLSSVLNRKVTFHSPIAWILTSWLPGFGCHNPNEEQLGWLVTPLRLELPSGKLTVCYWKWPCIVDIPIQPSDFPQLCYFTRG